MRGAGPRECERRRLRAGRILPGVLLGLALGGVALPAAAAGFGLGPVGLEQLGRETWTPETGLAGSWVRDIVKSPDGFLWVATAGGLSRFDGRTFVNYTAAGEPELPDNSVAALAIGAGDRLWIGLEHGGVRVLAAGRLRREPKLDAQPVGAVRTLVETADGTLWIGTESGLWRSGASGVDRVSPAPESARAEVRRLVPVGPDELLVRTRAHGLWRVRAGVAALEQDAPGCLGIDLARAGDGRLLTTCLTGVWERKRAGERWTELAPVDRSGRILVASDASIWFESRQGLMRRRAGATELLTPEHGVGDSRIRALYEDDDGDLWVGTFSRGLSRLRRGAVAAVGAPEGLAIEGTTAVLGRDDGSVWVGTFDSGVYLWRPQRGVERRLTRAQGLPSDRVLALAADLRRPERIWFGTERGVAVLEGASLRRLALQPGREQEEVSTLYADPLAADTLWACATAGGIHELRGGRFHAHHDEGNGLGSGRIRYLGRERSGTLLAGGDQGLFRFDGERWREVRFGGRTIRAVRAWAESEAGELWVASEESGLIGWIHGDAVRLGEREGLPFNLIFSLAFDRLGGLWLSGNDGLVRLRREDLARRARGEIDAVPYQLLSARDGLRQRECNGWGRPSVSSFPDGRLIYPTAEGIALVEPAALASSQLVADDIYIDRAWSGDRALDLARPLELTANERHLRVRFGAREFLRPEAVAFRYRLDGVNADWVTAARRLEAVYSYLTPGRYRFRVQARLPGERWIEAATTIPVVVAPTLTESTPFRLAAFALGLAGALGAYRWRTRVERAHHAALGRERAFLREVIDTSPNPIFAKSRDLTYALANRAAAEVYGLAPAELLGRSDVEFTSTMPGMDRIAAIDREVLETGEERILPEAEVLDAAGAQRWFRVVKRPLRGGAGRVEQVLGTAVDVTDFKVAEQRLRAREGELRSSREELRRLARQLLRAQEEERRRLAREIHDDLTQRLAGLAMLTGSLARTATKDRAAPAEASLLEIGHELERLTSDTQALARDLHPSLLENLGLLEALRSECATFGQRSGQRVRFEGHRVPAELPSEVSLGLYRIAQEALRNASVHARASEVRVVLESRERELVLSVEDSGSGFATSDLAGGAGIGLTSMAERARLIGADFSIESAPGRGTRVAVKVRLAPASQGDA